EIYPLACQGNLSVPEDIKSNLKCFYESYNNTFLKIGPLKVEELYLDPRVVKIHDAIYDSEINRIIELSKGKVERGKVVNYGDTIYVDTRLSKVYFLYPEIFGDHPFLYKIQTRIQDMTNLVIGREERYKGPLQINNYGLGGHYDLHCDATPRDEGLWRLASFMFYLTDVELGGATIFPSLNLTVFPEKGSAVFWYNAHANTLLDYRMYHSGCPVALGNKWVANQWI
ncbi:prolyl 4-hydroxylase subunit alpha-1-like, partial [Diaphorina citri]|uniref:Prolyl 4-hydroxylase subunit alpha-1-like n=1 Tax=Diaphorina citri TaxID=121845 RepID=A0A1S3DJ79_DIACI